LASVGRDRALMAAVTKDQLSNGVGIRKLQARSENRCTRRPVPRASVGVRFVDHHVLNQNFRRCCGRGGCCVCARTIVVPVPVLSAGCRKQREEGEEGKGGRELKKSHHLFL